MNELKVLENSELSRMAASMERATSELSEVNSLLGRTLGYRDVEEKIMLRLVDAQINLENAIEQYQAAHEDWIAASM